MKRLFRASFLLPSFLLPSLFHSSLYTLPLSCCSLFFIVAYIPCLFFVVLSFSSCRYIPFIAVLSLAAIIVAGYSCLIRLFLCLTPLTTSATATTATTTNSNAALAVQVTISGFASSGSSGSSGDSGASVLQWFWDNSAMLLAIKCYQNQSELI